MATKRISATDTVQQALKLAVLEDVPGLGHVVRIPTPLDRAQYEAVDTFLRKFGGRWDRKLRAHVFPTGTDMQTIVGGVVADGTVEVAAEDFFPTPPDVAALVIRHAKIASGLRVLEPSAGTGGLADEVVRLAGLLPAQVDVFEINAARQKVLTEKGYTVLGDDFLAYAPEPRWERVVMNPPFLRNAYLEHVRHAFACLAPGGRLAAVVSEALSFSSERPAQAFRSELLHPHGVVNEPLPEGSFKRSGTGINTRLIVLKKPGAAAPVPQPVAAPALQQVAAPPAAQPQPAPAPQLVAAPAAPESADVFEPAGLSQLSLF
jgi:hypothetical protein